MLFFCGYFRRPGIASEQVRQRVLQRHNSEGNFQDRIEVIYALAEEGAGFVVCEFADRAELESALEWYRDLMDFEVEPLRGEVNYEDEFGIGSAQKQC